jgi:hypothetical protein
MSMGRIYGSWDLLRQFWGAKKATATEEVKPIFDMLDLWSKYGCPGDPEGDSDYAAKTEALIHDWAKTKGLELSLFLPGHSPLTPAEAPAEASSIIDRGLGLITVLNTLGIVAEAASAGQMESVIWAMTNVINASGVPSIVQDLYKTPVEIGVKVPLQRRMNSIYQPNIPDPRTLSSLRSRGILDSEAYNLWMSEHGFPDWAAEMMAYAETKMPGFGDQLTLLQRGFIDSDTFTSWLRKSGLHPDTVGPLSQLRWQLPGYADIISVYMREGYLPEKWVEIPDEFITYMEQLGYSSKWAARLWGKHWVLPGVNLLYDMFHKKIIDYDTMAKMLKYHDFEPVWRDRLIANAYNMIPRVDLRRAYRYNMLSAEQLQERYEWLGFKTEDAQIMSGIALRSGLDRYYTRLETVARAAFRKGKLSEEAFIDVLRRINTPEEAISITLESERLAAAADVREIQEEPRTLTASQILDAYENKIITASGAAERLRDMGYDFKDVVFLLRLHPPRGEPAPPETVEDRRAEMLRGPRILSPSEVLKAYSTGLITREDASTRLLGMGYTVADASFLLSLSEPRPEPMEVNRELISAAATLYREGFMPQDEFEGYLRKAGLSESDISRKVDAEELRYRYDYLKDLVALAKTAYEKDVYTREELEGYLLYYGMQLDRVQAISSLEELKKLPKPKRAS